MRKFVLATNIERFRAALTSDLDVRERAYITRQIADMQRELALLQAAALGAQGHPLQFGGARAADRSLIRSTLEGSARPSILIDPREGLHILDLNPAYADATLTDPARVAGQRMFDIFPDNPDDHAADGVANLFASIRRAARTGQADAMGLQRYDVRDDAGSFVTRYWQPVNIPVINDEGHLVCILHQADDVTDMMLGNRMARAGRRHR